MATYENYGNYGCMIDISIDGLMFFQRLVGYTILEEQAAPTNWMAHGQNPRVLMGRSCKVVPHS